MAPQKPRTESDQVEAPNTSPAEPRHHTGPVVSSGRKRADVRSLSARRSASLRTWRNRRKMLAQGKAQREAWMTAHADEHRIGPNHPRRP